MASNSYRAVFNYDGKKPGYFQKTKVEKLYVGAYNIFCQLVNPMFEKWNRNYIDPDDGPDIDHYNHYIIEHYKPIFELLNRNFESRGLIKRFFSGDECDFRAELKDGTIMSLSLEEM